MNRRTVILSIAGVLLGFVLADTFGLFDSKPYVAIGHGNHFHYMPKDRDDGVTAMDCPTEAPREDEILTSQCQIVRAVQVNGQIHYLPGNANAGVSPTSFPTRPPGRYERITPDGLMVSVE